VALAAPSLHTVYGAKVDHRGWLAIAISQSGKTPEIVTVLERMRGSGAVTIAVTNGGSTPLAAVADLAVELEAGPERAVPATKTFTATLVALALISEALGAVPWSPEELASLPGEIDRVLKDSASPARVAERLDGADRILVTARGLLLCAALETALKIREIVSMLADGISSADLRHGPIAAVSRGFPVLAFSAPGRLARDLEDLTQQLHERGAHVTVSAPGASSPLPLPEALPEGLLPVAAAVRGQQLAWSLATRRGLDADRPRGLNKVTMTQ
jgi:glucosamine--fructose-6-phosphate aminotransferase (isomerizing)